MRLCEYDRERKRVHVCGARVHHGLVGLVTFIIGIVLMIDDIHDIPWTRDD
jgi:hypothetical protein